MKLLALQVFTFLSYYKIQLYIETTLQLQVFYIHELQLCIQFNNTIRTSVNITTVLKQGVLM